MLGTRYRSDAKGRTPGPGTGMHSHANPVCGFSNDRPRCSVSSPRCRTESGTGYPVPGTRYPVP